MATIGLARLLPKPAHGYAVYKDDPSPAAIERLKISERRAVPPYGKRQGFVPRAVEDFGDGGAFPEIHVAQYPLNMGKKDAKGAGTTSTAIVSVDVSADGNVNFDAIVKQGTNRNKMVFSKISDLKEKEADEDVLAKPTVEEEAEAAAKTKAKLEALIGGKVAAARPVQHAKAPGMEEPKYVRYTPNPSAPGYNQNAKQRVIELVDAQVDPLEPSKHKHKKIPRGPPEDPVPVMHSPPRKVSVTDQEAWKIPPCVSNWKNAKGYTVPLDKRMAADGRGLQEVTLNPKFAALPQALYIAEEKAREQIAAKDKIDQKMKKLEREQKEQELRELAARSRMARAGITVDSRDEDEAQRGGERPGLQERLVESSPPRGGGGDRGGDRGGQHMSEEERAAAQQREKLRIERRKELERDMRKENMKGAMRKNKLDRDEERDISEKIALGMHVGQAKLKGDEIYDARLFNQGDGVTSGFGGEDDYNVYSKALFDKGPGSNIYRPRGEALEREGDADEEYRKLAGSDKFRPDKGFAGAEYHSRQARDKPVQFEKEGARRQERDEGRDRDRDRESDRRRGDDDDDFFGVGEFVDDDRKGRKKPLDHIGSRGMMSGSAAGSREDLEGPSKRQRIEFSESGSRRR